MTAHRAELIATALISAVIASLLTALLFYACANADRYDLRLTTASDIFITDHDLTRTDCLTLRDFAQTYAEPDQSFSCVKP